MNIKILKEKLDHYYTTATPEQVLKDFQELGIELDTLEPEQPTQELSTSEAFDHFWSHHVEPMKRKPNELSAALCAHQGKAKAKNGTPVSLGLTRMQRLFDHYAPGHYEVQVTVLVK